ncbi:MAG: ankyrin repeat domain-containing protein [Gammaproteobacteria bacterium]
MSKLTIRAGGLAVAVLSLVATALSAAVFAQEESLSDLIRSGNREAVLAAITSPDIDVNVADPDGSTALLWATYKVDHELVSALLKAGAKANVTNHFGASPLGEAVKLGDVEFVRALLDAGADPESPNQDNQTALMLASSVGAAKVAELLIAKGANVNAVESFRGQTALMWASAGNHPEAVEVLVTHGANIKVRAKYDDWPRQMTSEPRAQFRHTGGLTALLYAARAGCYGCVVAMVKAGADINEPNPDGITPLINALDNRSYDIAMFLLDKGANPNAWDMTGRTPLYVAVDMNSFKGGFNFGNPPDPHPPNKATPMDVVNRLLKMGVDPNHELTRMRPNGAGRGRFSDYMLRGGTGPLMVAALGYDPDAITALLAHGAEVDLPNVFRITPLMAAAGMTGSFRSAIDPVGGTVPPPGDIQLHAIKAIDLLLEGGANINARVTDNHNRTARLSAYVYNRENEGKSALFAPAEFGWDKVVKHLLERGADPTLRDAAGKTALDYAREPAPISPGGTPADDTNGGRYATANRKATVAILEAAVADTGSNGSATAK